MIMVRAHLIVKGRVQGVFFRAFVLRKAAQLGLTGYVRNLPDSVVEVWAEGDKEKLDRLISYLEIGPRAASVDRVEVNWSVCTGDYSGFSII